MNKLYNNSFRKILVLVFGVVLTFALGILFLNGSVSRAYAMDESTSYDEALLDLKFAPLSARAIFCETY